MEEKEGQEDIEFVVGLLGYMFYFQLLLVPINIRLYIFIMYTTEYRTNKIFCLNKGNNLVNMF